MDYAARRIFLLRGKFESFSSEESAAGRKERVSGKHLKRGPIVDTVGEKMAIEGKNARKIQDLGGHNKRSVREVHRGIGVFAHKSAGA